jgi:hypothetical protein
VADYRVIQHVHTVMCDRIQEICNGLELNWVGIHKDLDTEPKDDEEATVYCALYRIADVEDFRSVGWADAPVHPAPGVPDPDTQVSQQLPPRWFYLYFVIFTESDDSDLSNVIMGAVLNGFHQQTTLLYRPLPYEIDGKAYDSTGRPLVSAGIRLERQPAAGPMPNSPEQVAMERISVALVDDLAFGDACLLLKGFERKVRPYLCYRVFAKIDQPLTIQRRVMSMRTSLFKTNE